MLSDVVQFLELIDLGEGAVGGEAWRSYLTRSLVGHCHLPLLDLFGFVEVDQGPPDQKGAWQPLRVRRTPFGHALGAVLTGYLDSLFEDESEQELERYGALKTPLGGFFPEYRKSLVLPDQPFREGAHLFRVSLGSAWRLIAISGTNYLGQLASTILDAFSFDEEHLYCFQYPDRLGVPTTTNHPYMDEGPWADEVEIGRLPLSEGNSMTFLYDFGEHWKFHIVLKEVAAPDPKLEHPEVLKGGGQAPQQYPDSDWE
jgi:hypothetical protein